MAAIHLALIEDQLLFRQSLALLLKSIAGFTLVLEAEDGQDFLNKLETATVFPDIALMDMEMPGIDGVGLKDILQRQYPQIKIIVLSVHARARLIAHMIEGGCSGYLVKNCDKEELIIAVNSVFKNGFYINARVLEAIQQAASQKKKTIKSISPIPVDLSAREKEILQLICKEYNNNEIAEQLFISVRTVDGHRNNLLTKTGCQNTAGLVLFAVKYNIIEVI